MHRIVAALTALALTAGAAVLIVFGSMSPASAKDADCGDFASQAAAQQYFLNHGGPNSDPDYLDADGDGIACESNPCPCSTSTGGGGGNPGGGGTHPQPQPKKKHALTAKVKRSGPAKKLTLTGKVPTFKGGQVQVFRKVAGGGFKLYKRTTASAKTGVFGRPLAYVGATKTCFQVVVPETKLYLKTVKFLGCFIKP